MSRSPISGAAGVFAALLLSAPLVSSCSLVELREVSVRTDPSDPDAVLPDSSYPVSVSFGSAMERDEAEKAFSVEGEDGSVEGDLMWSGKTMSFRPVDRWQTGVRYRLILKGTLSAEDGKKARANIDLPFFAVKGPGAPSLVSCYPRDGASVFADPAAGAYVELSFSEPMDGRRVESAFSLSPSAELQYSWNGESTVFRATPKSRLSVCAVYRWSLDSGALSRDGAPLARSESGRFATDGDSEPPTVSRTFAAAPSGASWAETGTGLSGIPPGGAFGVEFSEAMDDGSARRALSVSPALPGRADGLDSRRFVFIPDSDPSSGAEYVFTVSSDAEDLAGVPMGTDHVERLVVPSRSLRVLSVESDPAERYEAPEVDAGALPVLASSVLGIDGLLTLSIRFSRSLTADQRISALSDIGLESFFPATLASPELRSAGWPASDTAAFTWEGLAPSSVEYENYYRLTVSGIAGMGGDFVLIVEAKE